MAARSEAEVPERLSRGGEGWRGTQVFSGAPGDERIKAAGFSVEALRD